MMAALGAGMAHLSESQCERLLASVIDIRPGRRWRTVERALKELGVRMGLLSPALRERRPRNATEQPYGCCCNHARGDTPTFCVNTRDKAAALAYPRSPASCFTATPRRNSACAMDKRQRAR